MANTVTSASPQHLSQSRELPSPIISRRTIPFLFEYVTTLYGCLERIAGGGPLVAILFAETASACIALCVVRGRLVLDVFPPHHPYNARFMLMREVTLAGGLQQFCTINVVDALVRAKLHRGLFLTGQGWSDWDWIREAIRALERRGYVGEDAVLQLCMG